jgi:biopolymer transport protein ExbB
MIYNHLTRVIAGYRTLLGDASAQLLLMVSRGQRRRAASVQHAAE